MRVFLDSNFLISAFITEGEVRRLRDRLFKTHEVVVSEEVLSEVSRKLLGKFNIDKRLIAVNDLYVRAKCRVLPAQGTVPKMTRDPKDDWVLAAAAQASCRCILTGDDDLTVLGAYKKVAILRPRDFLAFEAGKFKRRKGK